MMRTLILVCMCFTVACATRSQVTQRSVASAPSTQSFEGVLSSFGLKSWSGNIHAHHYMKHQQPKGKQKPQSDADEGEEEASASCNVKGNFPEDDGKPCRVDRSGKELYFTPEKAREFVSNPSLLEEALKADPTLLHFKMACDYAFTEGGLDVLFVTPHSKNGEVEQDTSTLEEGFVNRQRVLATINESYGGRFYCGLGQEVSSISKGNHVNVFGHFTGAEGARPFFFPTGAFDQFYTDVKKRNEAGEKVFLQFNHPDIKNDLWWGAFDAASKKKKKTLLNDYGLDDYPLAGCIVSGSKKFPSCPDQPMEVSMSLLKRTFGNLRDASGDAYKLMEVVSPLGAASNAGVEFKKVHHRMNEQGIVKSEIMKPHDGLYNYIFYLAMGFKLGPTANQDNHFANWGSATSSRTGILAPSLSEEDVLDALKNRRTFASEDQNGKVVLYTVDAASGSTTLMGGDLTTESKTVSLVVSYADQDANDREARVRFFFYRPSDDLDFSHRANPSNVFRVLSFGSDGSVKLPFGSSTAFSQIPGESDSIAIRSNQSVKIELPLSSSVQYVFAEITQDADADKIISAPIWLFKR